MIKDKVKIVLTIFIINLLLSSCKTQNLFESKKEINDTTAFAYNPSYQYKIRIDDKITISIHDEDKLSVGSTYGIYNSNEVYGKWLLVDINGNIEIPKIGTTNVLGKTIPDLKEYLRNILKKWIINPIVDIKVLNKQITVLGEVRNPNTFQVDQDNNNLLQIISRTGGFDSYANIKCIKILRQEGQNVRVTNLDLTKPDDIFNTNIQLYPGDIVIVPSKKYKEFDKRISLIIPFTTTITAAAILKGFF